MTGDGHSLFAPDCVALGKIAPLRVSRKV